MTFSSWIYGVFVNGFLGNPLACVFCFLVLSALAGLAMWGLIGMNNHSDNRAVYISGCVGLALSIYLCCAGSFNNLTAFIRTVWGGAQVEDRLK